MTDLAAATWPAERLGEALEALGSAAALAPAARVLEVPAPPPGLAASAASAWIRATAAWLSFEAEPVEVRYGEVARFVRRAGPALLRIEGVDGAGFVALLAARRHVVTVLDPDRRPRRLPAATLESALCRPLAEPFEAEVERLLEAVESPRRKSRARHALLAELAGSSPLTGCWLLRSAPSTSVRTVASRARLPALLLSTVLAHAAEYAVTLLAWAAIAYGALSGRCDKGWIVAWILLLATLLPLRLLSAACASRFAIGAGILLKTRLLGGALRLDPNQIRHEGAGRLLGRVIESSAVETLALNGGLVSLLAVVEAGMCTAVLSQGAGGLVHVALFAVSSVVVGALGFRQFLRRRAWTDVRLSMTHDLVERMVGHRTRLAQEPATRLHDGEDQALERYLGASTRLDASSLAPALVPKIWLFLAVAALGPALLAGRTPSTPLAVALGGILLGRQALTSLATGASHLAGAAIAWQRVASLVRSAPLARAAPPPSVALAAASPAPGGAPLLDAEDVYFRYRERGEAILRGCSLKVELGDRLLLEGPSGGGKSTLGALLTGLREPDAGLLLLGGLDRHVLGSEAWRKRVVSAPQFHENHVFTGTFAFNLLMGRAWPPEQGDLEAAEALCIELGLGELIQRMPAGLQQMVGETGWQLSHGEKSRLYIARALLQDADLVVLDESFAALDPETLGRTLRSVLARARTLLVIAHP